MKRQPYRDAQGRFRRSSPEELAAALLQAKLDAISDLTESNFDIVDLLNKEPQQNNENPPRQNS